MNTCTIYMGMTDASRRILLSQRDRSMRIQRLQNKRLEVVIALLLCTTIELVLIISYWGVMPVSLVVFNVVCVIANSILIVWLLSVYSDVKKRVAAK